MRQRHQSKSSSGRCRRALAAAAFVCFSAAATYVASGPLHNPGVAAPSDDGDRGRRELSVALPDGGCRVTYAHLAPVPIPPTWQASFPGSGSRMTWSLVEALTGIRTNDDYDSHSRGYERVVAVKTHYPLKDARRGFEALDVLFDRAIVILRNPIYAVPSYFNLQYEHLNHLPNHSTRGPNEDWLEYRDHPNYGLAVQIPNYEKFVDYWMEKYDRRQLLLLSYEDLTDATVGPLTAGRIAHFLSEVEGVQPIAPQAIPCVWETIVNYKNVAKPPEDNLQLEQSVPLPEQQQEVPGVGQPPPVEEIRAVFKKGGRKAGNEKSNNSKNKGEKRNGQEGKGNANIENRLLKDVDQRVSRRKLGVRGGKTFAEPSSLRVGPKSRPYTAQNLADMVALFQRLAVKYSHDEEFVRIMQWYIGTVLTTVPVD